MGKVAVAALLTTLLVAGYVVDSGVWLVDVREANGPRLVVPVPVAAARTALFLLPDDLLRLPARDVADHLPLVERTVDALRDAPDAVLLEMIDGDDSVRVALEGEALRVRVIEGEATDVELLVPLQSAEAFLRAYDAEAGSFRASALIGALRKAPRGELLRLRDRGDRVRIRRVL